MTTPVLTQDAQELNLEWIAGDPISLAFVVAAVDWSGTYRAQLRSRPTADGALIGELTVSAVYATPDTTFTLTMTAVLSLGILPGTYWWDLQQTGGVTRLRGQARVLEQVTV
jgi:hypothetical protein